MILASTLQRKPYRNRAVGRYGFERSRPTNRHSPAATEVGGVRVAGGEPKRASKALTDTSRRTSRQIRDTVEGREQTYTGNNRYLNKRTVNPTTSNQYPQDLVRYLEPTPPRPERHEVGAYRGTVEHGKEYRGPKITSPGHAISTPFR